MTKIWIRVHKEIIVDYEYFMRHRMNGLHVIKETYKHWYNTDQVKEFNGEECLEFPGYNADGYSNGEIDLKFDDDTTVVLYYNSYNECLQASITNGNNMFGVKARKYKLENNSVEQKIKRLKKRATLVGSEDFNYTTDGVHVIMNGGRDIKNVEGMSDCFGTNVIGKRTKYVDCAKVEVGEIDDDTVVDYIHSLHFRNDTGKTLKVNCLDIARTQYINRRLCDAESVYRIIDDYSTKIDLKNMSRLKYLGSDTLHTESRLTYDFGWLDVDINREAVIIKDDFTLNVIAMNTNTLYRVLYSVAYAIKFGANIYGYANFHNSMLKVNAMTSEMPEWADKMAAMIDGLHIRVIKYK